MLPLIGITSAFSPETYLCKLKTEYYYIDCGYSKAIFRAGGLPMLIPPPQNNQVDMDAYADEVLKKVDAVYFAGGAGGGKCSLTHQNLPLYEQQPLRSEWEACLMKKAYELDIPVLGTCRGHQMITAALGGSLDASFYPPHRQTQPGHEGHHNIRITEDSLLSKLAGSDDWFVNSFHTQVVSVLPDGFIVGARSDEGLIESIESTNKTFFVGTQFHPELMIYDARAQKIINAFVAAAANYSQKKQV